MPYRPARSCSFPGCPELTAGRYCEAHQKQADAQYNKYERDPATYKRYGRTWKRIRDRYIAANPLCELCDRAGRIVPAEEVHHMIPLDSGGTHSPANLQSLCHSCHSAITARANNFFGRVTHDG